MKTNTPKTDRIMALHADYPAWQRLSSRPPGYVIAALMPRPNSGGYVSIDERYAYPVCSLTDTEIENCREWAWVICTPKNEKQIQQMGDGVSSVNFDAVDCDAEMLTGSYVHPQPHPLFRSRVNLQHKRRAVEVVGVGSRTISANWDEWYENLIPADDRIPAPAPKL